MSIHALFRTLKKATMTIPVLFIFAFPASTNYGLRSFEFGSGGEYDMSSASYSLEGLAGEVATERQSSTNYAANTGLEFVQMAHTPNTPTFTNDANWYDKLKIIISTSNNPSDTTFAVAISTDNFATTNYVQSDSTIGSALGIEDFRVQSSWGGGSGSLIIGLDPGTTYYVKVKARQGIYTEGPWGPIASAATVNPSISFDLDISSTDSDTSAPYGIDFGDLNVGSVSTTTNKIWVDFATNGYGGGAVYINGNDDGANDGLTSATTGYTVTSATADLAVATLGYGMQGSTVAETSGGPLALIAPYDGTSENVGVLDTTYREMLRSSAPIVGGRSSLVLKARITAEVPAADDYTDLLTVIAAASF